MMKPHGLFLILLGLTLASFFKAQSDKKEKRPSAKPNIILIVADDMGIGDLSGLNPDSKIQTPNIDKLIDAGIVFTDAHTSASVCTPSRYSIMTGSYPWRSNLKKGVLNGYSAALIDDSTDTAPKLLKRNDYTTALIGKWHLGWNWAIKDNGAGNEITEDNIDFSKNFSGGPTDRGFDYFYGISASLDFPPYVFCENNHITGQIDSFFNGNKKGEDKLKNKQLMQRKGVSSKDFNAGEALSEITSHSVNYIKKQDAKQPFFLMVSFTAPHTPVLPQEEFRGKSGAGIYGDFIMELDHDVGLIMEALKASGLENNTLVIFTADNGASRMSFPIEYEEVYGHKPGRELHGRKGTLHEGGHHVPFIAVWPEKIEAGTHCDVAMELTDLYATFADINKCEIPERQAPDSYSILGLLQGNNKNYQREISIYTNYGGFFSIRKGMWKMDMTKNEKKRKLYNIVEDRSEKNNLYQSPEYDSLRKSLLKDLSLTILNGTSKETQKAALDTTDIWPQIFWMNKNFTK